jgi:hypothetical protein
MTWKDQHLLRRLLLPQWLEQQARQACLLVVADRREALHEPIPFRRSPLAARRRRPTPDPPSFSILLSCVTGAESAASQLSPLHRRLGLGCGPERKKERVACTACTAGAIVAPRHGSIQPTHHVLIPHPGSGSGFSLPPIIDYPLGTHYPLPITHHPLPITTAALCITAKQSSANHPTLVHPSPSQSIPVQPSPAHHVTIPSTTNHPAPTTLLSSSRRRPRATSALCLVALDPRPLNAPSRSSLPQSHLPFASPFGRSCPTRPFPLPVFADPSPAWGEGRLLENIVSNR